MPVQATPKQSFSQAVRGFYGVDLRSESTDIRLGFLASSIGADLHTRPGTAVVHPTETTIATLNGPVVRIQAFGRDLYYIVEDVSSGFLVYKNGLALTDDILSFLTDTYTSLVSYQGLNESVSKVFIANRGGMGRIDGVRIRKWGIDAPHIPPVFVSSSGSGGLFDGTYSYVTTYARKEGGALVVESNPSVPSESKDIQSQSLTLFISIKASSDPQVTHIRVYRTQGNGSVYLFAGEVTNADTVYVDTKSDFELGEVAPSTHFPPELADLAVAHNDRIFIANSETNRLWWSEKFEPEYFNNFIDIGSADDKIKGFISLGGFLGLFTERRKYRVIEQLQDVQAIGSGLPFLGATTVSFRAVEHTSKRGTRSPGAITNTGAGIIFPARDGVFITDFSGPDQLLSRDIESLFFGRASQGYLPIDWQAAESMRSEFFKGRYYLTYKNTQSDLIDNVAVYSLETQGWYFYEKNIYSLTYDDLSDTFYAGSFLGQIDKIEDPDGKNSVDATLQTGEMYGEDRYQRKLFTYLRIDAKVDPTATLSVDLLIDGTSVRTYSITGNRSRRLLRAPPATRGYVWALKFTASGIAEIYGGRVSWMPLAIQ